MAILSKLREKTVIVIGVIGLALFAFVIGDAINKDGGGGRADVIGEINGEEITREAFSQELEVYKNRATGSGINDTQVLNAVWDGFVRERVFKAQLESAGVVVGENDVWQSIISLPYFQNDPSFKNDIGLFDEEKVKEFIANMREDAIGASPNSNEYQIWQSWLTTEGRIRQGVVQTAYTSLVNAGLGASLEEGKRDYLFNNTNINANFVYVPYTTVADSLISITNSDYKAYINEHKKEFEVEEARNIKYVKFSIQASEEDKVAAQNELSGYVEEFKTVENSQDFIDDVNSDLALNTAYQFKSNVAKGVAEDVTQGTKGDVFGPYEDNGYYKISKIEDIKKRADSVRASHILIAYAGSRAAGPDTTQSVEEARATADSLLAVVKRNSSKFGTLAEQYSVDQSSALNGGDLDWFGYSKMVPEFRDFCFDGKKGDYGIVETQFGFHIIRITDTKNIQDVYQLSTVARKIEASEATELNYYQEAEVFASKLVEGNDFDDMCQELNYIPYPANNIKALDENVPGIVGNSRSIVRWAFDESISLDDVKRFDIDGGFVVAVLDGVIEEGLATPNNAAARIKPILIKQKKAEIIKARMNENNLDAIATEFGQNTRTASNVTLASPTLSGVGSEPGVVGAMSSAPEGEVITGIEGEKGVFAIQVTSKEAPVELDNYDTGRNRLEAKLKNRTSQLYQALQDVSEIKDYRADIY